MSYWRRINTRQGIFSQTGYPKSVFFHGLFLIYEALLKGLDNNEHELNREAVGSISRITTILKDQISRLLNKYFGKWHENKIEIDPCYVSRNVTDFTGINLHITRLT